MVEKIDRDLLSEAIPLKSGEALIFSEISFCHFKVHVVAHKIHSEMVWGSTQGVRNIWPAVMCIFLIDGAFLR